MGFWAWVALSVFASLGSALIAAYQLSRKPGPPLEPFERPVKPVGTPIPVVFGTQPIEPVITWFGSWRAEPIKNVVGTSFFGFVQNVATTGYYYFVTCQALLCWGVVYDLLNIIFDENKPLTDQPNSTEVQSGVEVDSFGRVRIVHRTVFTKIGNVDVFTRVLHGGHETLELWLPTIYGGADSPGDGGGVAGKVEFYIGSGQHGPDFIMETAMGPGNVPSYRNLAYLVYNDLYVGTRPQIPPIRWVCTVQPNPVAGFGAINSRTIKSRIREKFEANEGEWTVSDVSPVYVLLAIHSDRRFGLSEHPNEIDQAQWLTVSGQVGTDGLGVSLTLANERAAARATQGQMFEIMDAVPRRNPLTNKLQLKLIREEDFDTMRQVAPDAITDADLTRKEWADTFNEVTIFYSNADKLWAEDHVTVRNAANVAATGSVRPLPAIHLPAVTYRQTALAIATRKLKEVSIRTHSGTLTCTRAVWDFERGDVARFSLPWLDLEDIVLRIRSINVGGPTANEIKLTVTEDVFSYEDPIVHIADDDVVPGGPPSIAKRAPTVAPSSRYDDTTGYLDLGIFDPDGTIIRVEVNTSVAGGTPSGWTELTGPVYDATVARSADGESSIAWRVIYNRGTGVQEISGVVTFPINPLATTTNNPVVVHSGSGVAFVYTKSGKQVVVRS